MSRLEYILVISSFILLVLINTILLIDTYDKKYSDKLECEELNNFYGEKLWH